MVCNYCQKYVAGNWSDERDTVALQMVPQALANKSVFGIQRKKNFFLS